MASLLFHGYCTKLCGGIWGVFDKYLQGGSWETDASMSHVLLFPPQEFSYSEYRHWRSKMLFLMISTTQNIIRQHSDITTLATRLCM